LLHGWLDSRDLSPEFAARLARAEQAVPGGGQGLGRLDHINAVESRGFSQAVVVSDKTI